MLPLIEHLRAKFPRLFQPWFADDAAAGGLLELLGQCFVELSKVGPDFGCCPESDKSILIVLAKDLTRAQEFVRASGLGFKVKTGHRCLGGFIGSKSEREEWLRKKIRGWKAGIEELAQVAEKYPQSAFAGLQKSLQHEWAHIQ